MTYPLSIDEDPDLPFRVTVGERIAAHEPTEEELHWLLHGEAPATTKVREERQEDPRPLRERLGMDR